MYVVVAVGERAKARRGGDERAEGRRHEQLRKRELFHVTSIESRLFL